MGAQKGAAGVDVISYASRDLQLEQQLRPVWVDNIGAWVVLPSGLKGLSYAVLSYMSKMIYEPPRAVYRRWICYSSL